MEKYKVQCNYGYDEDDVFYGLYALEISVNAVSAKQALEKGQEKLNLEIKKLEEQNPGELYQKAVSEIFNSKGKKVYDKQGMTLLVTGVEEV